MTDTPLTQPPSLDGARKAALLVAHPLDQDDLLVASLLLTADLDPPAVAEAARQRLADWETRLLRNAPEGQAERLAHLNHFLFEEVGLGPAEADYEAPASRLLASVIVRGRGIPLCLAVIYVHLGRRLGLDLHGVGFPGHFMVGLAGDPDACIDPYHAGRRLDRNGLAALYSQVTGRKEIHLSELHSALQPVAVGDVLMRCLRNLASSYQHNEDLMRLHWVYSAMLLLDPELRDIRRARGDLNLTLGREEDARHDFLRYLEGPADWPELGGPDAEDPVRH